MAVPKSSITHSSSRFRARITLEAAPTTLGKHLRLSEPALAQVGLRAVKYDRDERMAQTAARPTVLSPEQARALLSFTADHPQEALFSVALSLGLRLSEIISLRWADIDFTGGSLRLYSPNRTKREGLRLDDPKSEKAARVLRLPFVCIAALSRQEERQRSARERCGAGWKEGGFVFTTSKGTPMKPEILTREFKKAVAAAGLPEMRFHDLRHSCAALLLAQGVDPKVVRETLGHSTYQDMVDPGPPVIPQLPNEVADRMDQILSPTKMPVTRVKSTLIH